MTAETSQSICLEIDSALSNTTLLAMAVRGICAMTTLSPVEINRLELCLVEVVNNAIQHAYDRQSGHKVEALVELSETIFCITVSDWGAVMPAEQLEHQEALQIDPDLPDSWLCSGRGLYIVKSLMDGVEYSSHQGKNSLRMIKQLRH